MAARVPPPTIEEIAARAREIRRRWSPRETARGCGYKTQVVYTPISADCLTEQAACRSEFRPSRRIMRLN